MSSTKPRILIVITTADVGGAQIHVLQILKGLQSDYEFTLATGAEDYLTRKAHEAGILVEICADLVRPISPKQDLAAIRAMHCLIRKLKPDLVHAHSFKAGIIARLAAIGARTPALFTAHGWAFTPGAPKTQRIIGFLIESVLCRLCSGIITISQHDFNLAEQYRIGAASKRRLVANAANPAEAKAKPEKNPVKLLSVGRLTPVKNQGFLLRVLARLDPSITLTIIGEGDQRSFLEQEITSLGVGDRVDLPGEVINTTEFLSEAHIFVLCSDFEGLPLSILEAMSAGLPVVATDVGGVKEAVIDNQTGYLVPRRDEAAFTNKLNQLIADTTLRAQMGEQGHQHYLAHYQLARFLSQMNEAYNDLLKS